MFTHKEAGTTRRPLENAIDIHTGDVIIISELTGGLRMTLQDAVNIRCSRRKYLNGNIDYFYANKLKALIEEYNNEACLNIQLVLNNGEAFCGLRKSYGMFSGVQNYFGLIENKNDSHGLEKLGYYGELLVLNATAFGLGTCWVGGTFDRASCPFELSRYEGIACVITVGNVTNELSTKERLLRAVIHRKTKTAEEMYAADVHVPGWFMSGMKSVQKAPSAVNRQPVMFSYNEGGVTASVEDIDAHAMALDLGIAKLHFELGVGSGKWDWGNGAHFQRE